MLLQDTGRCQWECPQWIGYVGTAAFGCPRSEAPLALEDASKLIAPYNSDFRGLMLCNG
jgi:hypothetical protein